MSPVQGTGIVYTVEDLGAAVRRRRKKLGYTQEQVAAFNQCSPRFIGELERGKGGAGIERVITIANSLGLDIAVVERG
ncbi:MAG: helix-turn-helix domain-containing protein [Coriobacteriales bacterium]|jgi:transcriptional regulator with XRE-family HTH domain|nr:helix-turn-helix domain-containing protein [Coriobacteriales bacterium]